MIDPRASDFIWFVSPDAPGVAFALIFVQAGSTFERDAKLLVHAYRENITYGTHESYHAAIKTSENLRVDRKLTHEYVGQTLQVVVWDRLGRRAKNTGVDVASWCRDPIY